MPLYICATPIGNLEDITLRAIRILKEVNLIAAEDTRHTKNLLEKYQINTPLTSYHKFNIKNKTKELVNLLKSGKSIALVSDAGMPGISDPGYELIKATIENDIEVVPVPGAQAAVTALAASGLPTDKFVFEGFLSPKEFKKLVSETRTIILYEAPHRIINTLKELRNVLGNRKVSICRELTKKFEEVYRGTLDEVIPKVKPKGEFVIVVEGSSVQCPAAGNFNNLINDMVKHGFSRKGAAKILSKHFKISKNELYKSSLNLGNR